MCTDAVIAEIVTDFAQVLLNARSRERDNNRTGRYVMVNAVDANELIERKRNSERSGLACFLFCDRQAVAFPVLYDVTEPEVDHI